MKLLVLSNGKGEDVLAVTLLEALIREHELSGKEAPDIIALPLIGDGKSYKETGITTIGRGLSLPSQGFIGSPWALLKDIRSGLIGMLIERIMTLRKVSKDRDHIICVGDIVPVLLAKLFTKKPIIHVSTAVTVKFRKFGPLEMSAFRKRCELVFAKDRQTAEFLSSRGVNARFSGNLMIDDRNLVGSGTSYKDSTADTVALLPSSRDDAYDNIRRMVRIIFHLSGSSMKLLLPFSENLSADKLGGIIKGLGIKTSASDEKDALWEAWLGKDIVLLAIKGHFADALKSSKAAIGMTGTGNEQAVGLGVPLILIEEGSSASSSRLRFYEKLLEGSVLPLRGSDEKIASGIRDLLLDNDRLKKMSEAGRKTIGEPGAAKRMASEIMKRIYA
jgi:uncharacterized protein (TIGR03492 family)